MDHWDVIVIGGGVAGAALTYELARAGRRTMLLEQGTVAGGASGATMGMALWVGLRAERDLRWAAATQRRLAQLEAELDADLRYRVLPSLVLAPDDAALARLAQHAEQLRNAGFAAQVMVPLLIAEIEPTIDHRSFAGALYAEQAYLDGAALATAYSQAARRLGAEIRQQTRVVGFSVMQGRIETVHTPQATLSADHVVLAAGAWTRRLAALAEIDLPIYYIHGEALATTPLPPTLRTMLMMARGDGHTALERRVAAQLANGERWEDRHDDSEAVDVSAVQQADGRVLIGQISRALPQLDLPARSSSAARMLDAAAQMVPSLRHVGMEHRWSAPVPFTPDHEALVGKVADSANLFVCAGFKSALITVPAAAEHLAQQIADE